MSAGASSKKRLLTNQEQVQQGTAIFYLEKAENMYNTVTVPPPFPSVYALNKHDPLLVHSGNYPPNNHPQS